MSRRDPPKLSGTSLRAAVAVMDTPVVGDLLFAMMRKDMGIDEMLATNVPDSIHLPDDHAPLPSVRKGRP